jgi:hypothetical protein
MNERIKADDFSSACKRILDQYGDDCRKAVIDTVKTVAKDSAKELKKAGGFDDRTGKYRKGWTSKVETSRLGAEGVVYNRSSYYLTHLLEFGHAKQNGGRTRAFAHIEPVNENTEKELMEVLEKKL